jgi:hypothetical protein
MHPEPFDEKAEKWELPEGGGALSGSNQALSFILLKRDRKIFEETYPDIEVCCDIPFGFLRYMMTGGIWLPQKAPDFMFSIMKTAEFVLTPIMPLIAIHHVFVLKKKDIYPIQD